MVKQRRNMTRDDAISLRFSSQIDLVICDAAYYLKSSGSMVVDAGQYPLRVRASTVERDVRPTLLVAQS